MTEFQKLEIGKCWQIFETKLNQGFGTEHARLKRMTTFRLKLHLFTYQTFTIPKIHANCNTHFQFQSFEKKKT